MTTSTQVIHHERIFEVSPTRKLVMGIVEILIAFLIFLAFVRNIAGDSLTTFVMTPGGITIGKVGQLDHSNTTDSACINISSSWR